MASFTDRIPTFNPYVPQQPVEDMVTVGRIKQQQYDQNVQKIQQSMGEIAGLPMGRDVDKQYMQQKIDEMTNKLKWYAAGDFSNNQLTTSVRGMISGMANDEVVQNAVRSAMAVQKAQQLQSKYNAEGKGSPSNDWLLNTQLQKWYSDEQPGAIFNGSYKPYHDYNKDAREIVEALAADFTNDPVALDYDENGNVVGVRNALTDTEIEGLSVEKIQTALKAQLSPAAWEQIQIDGMYQYSGTDDVTFIEATKERYNSMLSSVDKKIAEFRNHADKASSANSKLLIEAKIKGLEEYQKNITREFNSITKKLDSNNLDGAKAQLFTIDWMDNISNSMAYTKIKNSVTENPYKTVQLKEAEMRQELHIEREKMRQRAYEFMIETSLKNRELDLKEREINGETGGGDGGWGAPDFPVEGNELANDVYVNQKISQLDNDEQALNALKLRIGKKHDWITFDEDGNEILDEEKFNQIKQDYYTGKTSVDIDVLQDIKILETEQAIFDGNTKMLSQISNNAEKLYSSNKERVLKEDEKETFFVQDENQVLSEFTTKEILDSFQEFENKYEKSEARPNYGTPGMTYNYYIDDSQAEKDFTIRATDSEEIRSRKLAKKAMYTIWRNQTIKPGRGSFSSNFSISDDKGEDVNLEKVAEKYSSLRSEVSNRMQDNKEKYYEYMANKIKGSTLAFNPKAYGISLNKPEKEKDFKSLVLTPLLARATRDGVKVDIKNVGEWIYHFDSAFVIRDNDNERKLVISAPEVSDQFLTIDLDQKTYNDVFKDRFDPSPDMMKYYQLYLPKLLGNIPEVTAAYDKNGNPVIDEYGNQVYKDGAPPYWTSAIDGQYKTTFYNGAFRDEEGFFPNVKFYTVRANISTDVNPVNADTVILKLFVEDPSTGERIENLTFPVPVSVSKIDATLRNLDDNKIWQLINKIYDGSVNMPKNKFEALKNAASEVIKSNR